MAWKSIESRKQYDKKYYLANKVKIYSQHRIRVNKIKDKIQEILKLYYAKNKSEIRESQRKYYEINKFSIKDAKQKYYSKNKAKIKLYVLKNIVRIRKNATNYRMGKYYSDPLVKLRMVISTYLQKCLKQKAMGKNSRGYIGLLGYDVQDLKLHLEKQFSPEMSWGNYGSYWHIDHKTPISFAKNEQEVVELFQLDNLQPLEAKVNISKGNRVIADLFNLNMGALV